MRPAGQTFRAMPTRRFGRPPLLSLAACAPAAAPGLAAPNLLEAHPRNGRRSRRARVVPTLPRAVPLEQFAPRKPKSYRFEPDQDPNRH
jgi:hypothetical protein